MSKVHTIRTMSTTGLFNTLTIEVFSTIPGKLVASGLGLNNREFAGVDLFAAFLELREELEKAGHLLLCAGSRVDVWPSGMSRSMCGGVRAYIDRRAHV